MKILEPEPEHLRLTYIRTTRFSSVCVLACQHDLEPQDAVDLLQIKDSALIGSTPEDH